MSRRCWPGRALLSRSRRTRGAARSGTARHVARRAAALAIVYAFSCAGRRSRRCAPAKHGGQQNGYWRCAPGSSIGRARRELAERFGSPPRRIAARRRGNVLLTHVAVRQRVRAVTSSAARAMARRRQHVAGAGRARRHAGMGGVRRPCLSCRSRRIALTVEEYHRRRPRGACLRCACRRRRTGTRRTPIRLVRSGQHPLLAGVESLPGFSDRASSLWTPVPFRIGSCSARRRGLERLEALWEGRGGAGA